MSNFNLWAVIILFTSLLASPCFAQNATKLTGTIKDEAGKPVAYANIFFVNTSEGTTSDEDGSYFLKTTIQGEVTLLVSSLGYEKQINQLYLDGKELNLNLVLREAAVNLKELVVTGSSFGSEKEKGLVISRIDILTTPGGAADIFQALKTLPGLTQVSESAELYVRGGDPIETVTMIDGATLYHPYTYESAYGGIFSNLNQSSVKSLYFSSGGFSTKYGNALSGVLDIETRNLPDRMRHQVGLSMANVSLTSDIPMITDKLGGYIDLRQSYTKPIFWMNGGSDRMVVAPLSGNATAGLVYSYSKSGRVKLFGIAAKDEQGVKVDRAEYNGVFNGNSENYFLNLTHVNLYGDAILIKSSFAINEFANHWQLGGIDLEKTESVSSTRHDFEITLPYSYGVHSGVEGELRDVHFLGTLPEENYDIRPDGKTKIIDTGYKGSRLGIYADVLSGKLFGFSGLSFTGGMRFDYIPLLKVQWTDPRAAVAYQIDDASSIRFGWGIYHQLPDPQLFREEDGNPNLKAMKAEHSIAAYDRKFSDLNSFRLELYHKKYSDLPKENETSNYTNQGTGFANGIDLILKTKIAGIDGWISYGYITTKRDWMDYKTMVSSSFDITHNLSLVMKYNLTENLQVGINAKYATGRPFTPIINALFKKESNIFEPVYGTSNTERYPDYTRLDIRLTWFGELYDYPLVAYAEALNILNINNIFGYTYSPDYKMRQDIKSYFGRRMVVLGAMITI